MAKNGLELITPTSIAYTGTSATVSANGSVTFEFVDNITLNGVFGTLYDNYRIVMKVSDFGEGVGTWNARLTAGGSPVTVNYNNQFLNADGTSVTASRTTGTTRWLPTSSTLSPNAPSGIIMDIYGPALTLPTAMRSITAHAVGMGVPSIRIDDCAGVHSSASAWDGVQFVTVGSNGRVAVYGMRK